MKYIRQTIGNSNAILVRSMYILTLSEMNHCFNDPSEGTVEDNEVREKNTPETGISSSFHYILLPSFQGPIHHLNNIFTCHWHILSIN